MMDTATRVRDSRTTETCSGGYVSLDSVKLVGLWLWCAREGRLTTTEFRTLLGAAEQRKRRVGGERQRFTESELSNITGLSKRRLRRSVARLETIGLLRYSEAAIEFSVDDRRICSSVEEQQSWWRYRGLLSARKRRLPVPRRMLVRMARDELKFSVSLTLLAQLTRSSWAWGKKLNPEGCATETWLSEVTGKSTRTVRRHRRMLEKLSYLATVDRGYSHRQRFGTCYRLNLAFGDDVCGGTATTPRARFVSGHPCRKPPILSSPYRLVPSFGSKHQNLRRRPGVQEPSRKEPPSRQPARPSIHNVQMNDLTNDVRFAGLHRSWLASKHGMTGGRWKLHFYAARETALRKGRRERSPIRNVPAFFRWMVSVDTENPDDQEDRLQCISQGDEDAARRKLAACAGLRIGIARARPSRAVRRRLVYERNGLVFVRLSASDDTASYVGETRTEIQALIRQSIGASGGRTTATFPTS